MRPMSAIKTAFIAAALREYMSMTKAGMRTAMRRARVGSTGAAEASLDDTVSDTRAELSFKEYLRFVDMGVGKGNPIGGMKATRVALQGSSTVGMVQTKNNSRKAKKIYSKVAYGNLSWLQGKILFGYSEEVIEMLKKELEGTG